MSQAVTIISAGVLLAVLGLALMLGATVGECFLITGLALIGAGLFGVDVDRRP